MKKVVLVCALAALGATSAIAQPSISIGPGGIGVDVDRRDRDHDRRWREREVVTGSTRRSGPSLRSLRTGMANG
jgi:hypothetical protein